MKLKHVIINITMMTNSLACTQHAQASTANKSNVDSHVHSDLSGGDGWWPTPPDSEGAADTLEGKPTLARRIGGAPRKPSMRGGGETRGRRVPAGWGDRSGLR